MLVLSRQKDESFEIQIPPGHVVPPDGFIIRVMQVDIRGDKSRIGIECEDKRILIHRTEVANAIRRDQGTNDA